MKKIECNLPDVNFIINLKSEYYDLANKALNESIISYKKNTDKNIEIEYIVDADKFLDLIKVIKNSSGKIYDSFKNQTHKEVELGNRFYYLVNCEEYICVKNNDFDYQIIVKENNATSLNWIIRVIRELYLREKEDLKYAYMHGTGLEVENKGLLLLGTSGSGKTTLAVKFLELEGKKKFLSNDRVLVNECADMDYFPHAVTYAMGTVKNNKHLDEYFKRTRILESKKKIKYEDATYTDQCNTPLTDVEKVFETTNMVARTKLDTIIYPRFNKKMEGFEIFEMTDEEKRQLLEETNFTPNDTEALRKPWIRKRYIDEEELLDIRKSIIEHLIENVNIKKVKYGVKTNARDIFNNL